MFAHDPRNGPEAYMGTALRDRYQITGTVKDRSRSSQPRMATDVKRQLKLIVYRRYLHRRHPFRLATVSVRRIVGLKG